MNNLITVAKCVSVYIIIGIVILVLGRSRNVHYMRDIEIPGIIFWPINLIIVGSSAHHSIRKQFKEYFELLGVRGRFK